jgi:hypothetical protein
MYIKRYLDTNFVIKCLAFGVLFLAYYWIERKR